MVQQYRFGDMFYRGAAGSIYRLLPAPQCSLIGQICLTNDREMKKAARVSPRRLLSLWFESRSNFRDVYDLDFGESEQAPRPVFHANA